ncbi:heparan-alpha-glucosaminide N-acetyltransferase domain-containing protein [Cryobacterium sp. Y82]|uniref:heparan-alpha-glucosaminide N-acetyltransferase domain-containing protein n=1 Tax=Cryobacterium sp. Y82 TaxID=2045017 RepID=UPI000CE47872|nr:heparan-alpha-glucosaminide N-acetyltransferase domain-containing protein [Cryobacterium sp. Y82]
MKTRPDPSERVVGIDIARGLAIVGMFVAHAIPRLGDAELLADGRSSILFATLAGVSLGIMTGSQHPLVRGQRSDRVTGIVVRALVLFLLGVVLASLHSGVAVILHFYALMFLLLIPMLFLRRWLLALIGVVFLFGAPWLGAAQGEVDVGAPPVSYFVDYFFLNGTYPVLIWMPFLIAGLIITRSDLLRAKNQVALVGVGTTAAVAGYGAAIVIPGVNAVAHSGSIAEVTGSGGIAVAVIGALLWLTAVQRRSVGRALRVILWPVGATGSMALTVYTVQILALTVIGGGAEIDYPGWPLLIGMLLLTFIGASLWRYFLGKGPLERLLATLARAPSSS